MQHRPRGALAAGFHRCIVARGINAVHLRGVVIEVGGSGSGLAQRERLTVAGDVGSGVRRLHAWGAAAGLGLSQLNRARCSTGRSDSESELVGGVETIGLDVFDQLHCVRVRATAEVGEPRSARVRVGADGLSAHEVDFVQRVRSRNVDVAEVAECDAVAFGSGRQLCDGVAERQRHVARCAGHRCLNRENVAVRDQDQLSVCGEREVAVQVVDARDASHLIGGLGVGVVHAEVGGRGVTAVVVEPVYRVHGTANDALRNVRVAEIPRRGLLRQPIVDRQLLIRAGRRTVRDGVEVPSVT